MLEKKLKSYLKEKKEDNKYILNNTHIFNLYILPSYTYIIYDLKYIDIVLPLIASI
jgi:hypothetical protein